MHGCSGTAEREVQAQWIRARYKTPEEKPVEGQEAGVLLPRGVCEISDETVAGSVIFASSLYSMQIAS